MDEDQEGAQSGGVLMMEKLMNEAKEEIDHYVGMSLFLS